MARPLTYGRQVKVHLSEAQYMLLKDQARGLGLTSAALIRGLVESHLAATEAVPSDA